MRLLNRLLSLLPACIIYGCSTDGHPADIDALKETADNASLRILAIGNSFTDNSTLYIPELLTLSPDNTKKLFFAKITQAGSSLEMHWNNHLHGSAVYSFSFADAGGWITTKNTTLDAALDLTQWDIIVLQQVSGLSGIPESYHPYISNISTLIRNENPGVTIGWQMTWAYSNHSTHADFAYYGNSRTEMFDAIVHALSEVTPYTDFIIPSGTLIERLRASSYNDSMDLTADGYHLDQGMPCLALSCLWHEIIIAPCTGSILDAGHEEVTVSTLSTGVVPFELIVNYIHDIINDRQ